MSDKVRVTRKEEGQYCGGCCHFKYEDTDGWGFCAPLEKDCESSFGVTHCSNECTCDCFASEEFKRRQLAVLRKCQRCLQSNIGTEQALDVEDICFAIDFLIDYAKLY